MKNRMMLHVSIRDISVETHSDLTPVTRHSTGAQLARGQMVGGLSAGGITLVGIALVGITVGGIVALT